MFAPIASASVITAVAVKPGFFASIRRPNFMSCQREFINLSGDANEPGEISAG